LVKDKSTVNLELSGEAVEQSVSKEGRVGSKEAEEKIEKEK